MDESIEIIEKFASLLQRRASEQAPKVYKDVKTGNKYESNTIQAGDIITNVAKQIKILQGGLIKMSTRNTKTLVKTPLVPVNVLTEALMPQVKQQPNDHIEEAACYGVTQEFETTFDQELSSDLPNPNKGNYKDTPFHIIDISLKEPDPNKNVDLPVQKDIKPKFASQFENCTQVLNECIEIENIDRLSGLFIEEADVKDIFKQESKIDPKKEEFTQRSIKDPQKEEFIKSEIDPKKEVSTQRNQIDAETEVLTPSSQKRSPSPVFSVKSSKTKSKTTSLVFNLDSFEKFEGIATSLVDEDTDLNTTRQLINSQIFGKELYLQKDEAAFLERDYSPIIELNAKSLKIDRITIPEIPTHKNKHSNNTDETNSNMGIKETNVNEAKIKVNDENNYLEDEILFSSDEEDERSSKSFKDLPFTCALETSFYEEESQVLDKTMFVGFQTASNKSILVKTDSFGKAKNLFGSVDESLRTNASVTELVELQSKSITNKDTDGNSLSNKDVNVVIKPDKQSIKITTINRDANSTNETKQKLLNNSDIKKELPEKTPPSPQSTSVSENIPDVILKKVNKESSAVSNIKNDDKNNAEQVTEEIHRLDDDILLEFQDEMTHKELNSEPLEKTNEKSDFNSIGFKTASNKHIDISDAALAKSKKLLQDVNLGLTDSDTAVENTHQKQNSSANVDLVRFKTASNKDIKISDKALRKIKSVFHDIDLGTLSEDTNASEAIPDSRGSTAVKHSFQTAVNKDIVVSEKALSDAKIHNKDLVKQNRSDNANDTNNTELSTTDRINIKEPSLSDEDTSDSDIEPPFFGFEHNKDEQLLLQEVFERSQKIFEKFGEFENVKLTTQTKSEAVPSLPNKSRVETIVEEEKLEKDSNNDCLSGETSGTGVFEGFKTASNKRVFISDKALKRSRKMFQDIQEESSLESRPRDTSNVHDRRMKRSQEQQDLNEPPTKRQKLTQEHNMVIEKEGSDMERMSLLSDFEKASNKPAPVPEEVKTESEKLQQNFNQEKVLGDVSVIEEYKGFQTASKRPIIVSEEALEKSKNLFPDIVSEKFDEENIVKKETPKEKDLGKSLKLSQEIHEEMFKEPFLEDSEKVPFIGFDTETNEPINLSEKSLEERRKLIQIFEVDMEPDPKNIDEVQAINTEKNENINTSKSTQSKAKPDNVPEFKEFQTASNKAVKVSGKVLEESKKIFQGLEDYAEQSKLNDVPKFIGFQTASNKEVKISKETLEKSRKLFQDLDGFEETNQRKIDDAPKFTGFQTASNKEVKVSEKALEKSRKLFQDLDSLAESDQGKIDDLPKFTGFQTASNKEVKISENALEKSRKLFQDLDDLAESDQKKIDDVPEFTGFQTAGKKEVKISEKALEKSKKLFQGLDSFAESDPRKLFQDLGFAESDPRKVGTVPKFTGFQTASKKDVKISEKALEMSRKLFQDLDSFAESDPRKIDDVPKFTGFQTASNKEVKISENALAKSRKLLQDLDVLAEFDPSKIDDNPKFTGFQTASNKEVKVSEKALEKSRKLFQDLDVLAEFDPRKVGTVSKFTGFQTASKKEVIISENAVEKSRKLFEDLDGFQETDQRKIDETPKFTGFQTASSKAVKISEEALEKSRKLFQGLEDFVESDQRKINDVPEFTGFQTASRKEVKISATALEKFRKLKDIDHQVFTETKHKVNDQDKIIFGFQTGNNKEVKVPKKVSPRTRQIFQNLIESKSDQPSTIESKTDDAKLKFGFATANNKNISVSNKALLKSKALFENFDDAKTLTSENESKEKQTISEEVFEINTDVLNDFDMTFKEITPKNKDITPVKSKRSGSPILSCPKAKKRKIFKIPYSQKTKQKEGFDKPKFKPPDITKSQNKLIFSSEYKKSKAYTLKDLVNMETESKSEKNVDTYIQNFNFENLLSFEFSGKRNDINNSSLNIKDLKLLFQNSVNKKLIPDGWLDIQLKLIIWKLLSYEIKFPKIMNIICTARNVIEQLKFRYDKELYNSERPILRKIMEKDDVSTRTMILCVVSISEEGDSSPSILTLTDGWYTIKAIIDKMLSKYVSNGKIQIGTKLITQGAELVGGEQAVAPWEDTSSIRLKLFGNSTRRARWDARLGCHGNAALLSQLSNVTVEGGKVPKLRVLVSRVYPPLYVDKFDDGSTVTRSERLEHLHQMKYESERQAILDKIYEEVEREVDQDSEDSESSGCSNNKKKKHTESEMAKIMKRGTDTQFLSQFTSTQKDHFEEYNEKKRERIMAAIQSKVQNKMAAYGMNVTRNIVTVLKVRVVDIEERGDNVKVTKAMLSIWRPNDAITEVVKENSWIEVLNVSSTAFRYSELQLSAGRQSIFSHSKHKESNKVKPYTLTLKRTCYPIKDLVKNPTMTTDYNEIDTIGIVFQTDPTTKDFEKSKQLFQNVYLADNDKNIISINFWGGLKKFGFENCLDTGQIVAGINLQKRAGNTRKSIPQYRVTEFSYFTKTPKNDDARKMIAELSSELSKIKTKDFLEECIRIKDNYSKKVQISENISPYRFPNMDMNSSKTKMFLDTPLAQRKNEKDENFHLTGLDFESSFKQETQEYSPKLLLRKQQLEQKMAKLKMYGEPPALSPIQIINKSRSAGKAYKSPLISKSDVSDSVANKEKNLPNQQNTLIQEDSEKIDCSPVICFNRTYVKNSDVKPVKLNFSKNDESATDDFAEEFDNSRL